LTSGNGNRREILDSPAGKIIKSTRHANGYFQAGDDTPAARRAVWLGQNNFAKQPAA